MSDVTTAPQPEVEADERLAYRGVFQKMLIRPEIGAAIGAIAIWVFFWAVSVPFGLAGGAASILDVAASPLGIMAVAVAMLMIGGEFDLSSGAATGALGILTILMVRDVLGGTGGWGLSLWIALPLSLIAALMLGWFNGTVVDRTGLPSFIVTLASFFVLKGAKLGFSKQIVEQIQAGKLDDLLIQADQQRLIVLQEVGNAGDDRATQMLNSLGIDPATPVEGLELGAGDFAALIDAVRTASVAEDVRGLEQLAALSRPFIDVSDRGYSTLNDIFAYDWLRNEHIWDWRDQAYSIGTIAGLSLIALAIYELHFRRRDHVTNSGVLPLLAGAIMALVGVIGLVSVLIIDRSDSLGAVLLGVIIGGLVLAGGVSLALRYRDRANANGIADAVKSVTRALPLLPGVGIALIGVWRLHATDSVGGNTLGAVVIFVGMLVAVFGWGLTRYHRRASLDQAADALADAASDAADGLGRGVLAPLVVGVGAIVASIALAARLNPANSTDIVEQWSLSGWAMLLIALVVGVVAGVLSMRFGGTVADDLTAGDTPISRILSVLIGTSGQRLRTMSILGVVITIVFLDQATVQGARAIFFLMLAAVGAIGLLSAASQARRTSHALGSVLLLLTSAVVAGIAFFIRSESGTPKFRTQAFTVMLVIAGLMAIWALATMVFEVRDAPDDEADSFGRTLAMIGTALFVGGVVIRLMAVTQAEFDLGVSPTRFSVRILWFIAFTAVATWVLGRTRFGSWTFAVGGNTVAARQVGVPAARTKTQLFMIVSAAAWLVGVLLAFRLNTIQASTGDGEEFEYIIAAVVGGNALTGGRGSTLGAAIGALIMAMAVQGIPSSRWNSDWRFVFVGSILLLAVIANNFIRNKAEAAR